MVNIKFLYNRYLTLIPYTNEWDDRITFNLDSVINTQKNDYNHLHSSPIKFQNLGASTSFPKISSLEEIDYMNATIS